MNDRILKKAQKLEIFFFFKSCPALFQSALSLRARASATTSSTVRPLRTEPSRWMDMEKWRVSVSITLKRLLCLLFSCTGYPDNDRILTTLMFPCPPAAHLSSYFVCSAWSNYRPPWRRAIKATFASVWNAVKAASLRAQQALQLMTGKGQRRDEPS